MKSTRVFSLLLLALFLAACGVPGSPMPVGIPDTAPVATRVTAHPFDVAWDDREIFRAGLVEAEQPVLDQLPGATVYHIDVQIANDFRRLQGSEQALYTNQEDTALDEIYFRLFPNILGGETTVSALTVDGQSMEPSYEFMDTAMRVPLSPALQPGDRVEIRMDFQVKLPLRPSNNFGMLGYLDDILVLDGFYPAIPVYDDEGWNVELPHLNADLAYYDASFYLVRVAAPSHLTVVASGVEVGREYGLDDQVLTFAAGPARDFYVAASARYVAASKTVGETTINHYAVIGLEDERAGAALQYAQDALKSFGERFGAYPYTEFDIISTPTMALGMEYPGLAVITIGLYEPDSSILMLESTVVHEVGHQWFYNLVGSDQVDEPWVDEAVTQYVTGLYYRDNFGSRAEQDWHDGLYARWNRVTRGDVPIGLPAASYASGDYGPVVYGRGPLFIVALEELMWRDTFDEFLRDYAESNRWGIGAGDEFKQLAESHCQCDLTALFEEWVYGK